jgi:FAD/FMN-containing dehydrogenase
MQGVKHLMDPKGILNPYKVGLYKLMSSVYP